MKLGSCAGPDSRADKRAACALPSKGCGSLRVFTRTVCVGLAADPVGIGQLEPALVFRPRLQVQDAAGEAVGDGVVEILALPVDVLAADPHQRQRLPPAGSPTGRNWTATVALRFASPRIAHSKPRFRSVGCSTTNRPACVLLSASVARASQEET